MFVLSSLDCMFIVVLSDVFRMICLCVFICGVFVSRFLMCVLFVWRFSAGGVCVSIFLPRVFNDN